MYTLEVNTQEIEAAVKRLQDFGADTQPLMRGIGGVLTSAIERGFDTESDPVTGEAWAELSPVTLARRAARGHSGKILQVRGQLAASFAASISPGSLVVGTNVEYATTMHFGAAQGEFGPSSRNGPLPWGDIPARHILPVDENGAINPEDEAEIEELLQKNLARVFSAG